MTAKPPISPFDKFIARQKLKRQSTHPTPQKKSANVFYHSGDVGDIIYSLPFVKAVGGGDFYVGQDTKWDLASKHDTQRYQFVLPLLAAQTYINKAQYSLSKPRDLTHDLNLFREWWFTKAHAMRIAGRHARLIDAYFERFHHKAVSDREKWLSVPNPLISPSRPIVVHRSPRYHNDNFPWREVASRYAGKMIFVGFSCEYDEWKRICGDSALFIQPENALHLARIIAGSQMFIGNQSSAMAIALGLGINTIQETCLGVKDCVLSRKNVQCITTGGVVWPEMTEEPTPRIKFPSMNRYVVPMRTTEDDRFEIGLCADADGLGDTLTITPIAKALGKDCVLRLAQNQARYAFLFRKLCDVEISDDAPVFEFIGGVNACKAKLDLFGIRASPLPYVDTSLLDLNWSNSELGKYQNPVCFVPTCAKRWEYIRQRPPSFWEPFIAKHPEVTFLQFGREEYPTVKGAVRMPFIPLEHLAAMYAASKRYIGVDTGDAHLMIAVGGCAIIAVPEESKFYTYKEWVHISPNVLYVKFSQPDTLRVP
jgi:hypothetical protein